MSRILIAGIGNIFLGDDAFGVEVVCRLARRCLPDGVEVRDFGIRGLDLTYTLLDGWDVVILVDAVPRGEPPGTLFVIVPETDEAQPQPLADIDMAVFELQPHQLAPDRVLQMVQAMGGRVGRLRLVGCEPAPLDSYDVLSGLSPAVKAALEPAVVLVESLIEQFAGANVNQVV